MCGIAGWVGPLASPDARSTVDVLNRMTDCLRHRGPDDRGVWCGNGVALGHRRLSVIDLEGGHQPMHDRERGLVIVYNGEIYNFPVLRKELERCGHRFQTRSDTEVLLAAYAAWGTTMPERLDGMFAFALWDDRRRRLFVARDRAGEKPFHYAAVGQNLVFGSEIKALLEHPAVSRELDLGALARYLAHEYVPAPHSIFRDIRKLPAAHALTWDSAGELRIWRYWRPRYTSADPPPTIGEARERLSALLDESIRERLISDVPLGVFLSGGIDSSTIVAVLTRRLGHTRTKTFSVAFREKSFDESTWARSIAERFGTEHHEETLDAHRMVETLPEILERLDEPFADPSIVPTYLLSRFTRRHVTVALGGDGGDELFAGYPTFTAQKLARVYNSMVPGFAHALLRRSARALAVSHRNMSFDFLLNTFLRGTRSADHRRHIDWLGAFTSDMQRELWQRDSSPPLDDGLYEEAYAAAEEAGVDDPLQRVLNVYFRLYLQDDILTKVDRASMMHSLEARCPFLDVELMETVQALPARLKMPHLRLKHLLKETVRGLVPDDVLARPKKGFGIPVGHWFRQDLRGELQDTLSRDRVARGGLFAPEHVQRMVREHVDGRRNHRKPLWTLYMFEKWRERWAPC